jgi:hexosaminidase
MCSYLSFFKQNTFHIHLSDNLYNNLDIYSREESLNLAAAFRLLSDDPAVAGLNRHGANESYTREQFDNVQTQCARRGVTIIPEIEAPGHALVIVQWKPELGLDDLSMLNISHPDTIPTMKTIWKTFLPWFHSKVVHIGADEYDSSLVSEYTHFVNEMNTFIQTETKGSKSMRIWGTFTPKQGANVSKSISYQHWDVSADQPYYDYIENGYNVLNSDDYLYLVGGWSGSFAQTLDKSKIFNGPYGAPYSPVTFDTKTKGDNPARNNPHVLGEIAAIWNDYGQNSTTVLQAYYSWRDALPALADKQWGGNITEEEYNSVFDTLHASVPAQNLDRKIPSKSDTILKYTFDFDSSNAVTDHSGNGYHGTVHGCKVSDSTLHLADGCYLETPLGSKGRDYTLSFRVKPTSSTPGTLFAGPDSMFVNGNGTVTNTTLISGGSAYSLNYTLPVQQWTDVSLVANGNKTMLTVSGEGKKARTMEFLAKIGVNGEYFVWAPVEVEAPLARIGEGFTGLMQNVVLRGTAW